MAKWYKKVITALKHIHTHAADDESLTTRIKHICDTYEQRAREAYKRHGKNILPIYEELDSWVHAELMPDYSIVQYTHTYSENQTRLCITPRDAGVGSAVSIFYED